MGRKVHPIGFRLGIHQLWEGRWYAEGAEYTNQLHQDLAIRKLIHGSTDKAGVSKVEVERFPGKVKVIVHTAKPGILIGRKGDTVKVIRQDLEALDCDAYLVARNIADQIERRVSYRRAMKRAVQQAMRQGALGIKLEVAGRLSGAEMAREVKLREGRVPSQTLRANIDFALAEALTTYGRIGVKVWIYLGEVLPGVEEKAESTEGVYVSE